ncbi:MAG: PilZ domain-containing protein [Terriglobales bacterium]
MGQVQEVGPGGVSKPERRKHPRYQCALPVEIRQPGASFPSQGQTTDVCLGGCYISTRFNLTVGSEVELKIWVGDIGLKMNAIVRTSDPGVGNGMEFVGLDEQGAKTLADYFAKLEGSPAPAEPSIRDLLIM